MSITPQHTHNQPEAYSVTEISGLLKKTVEETFSYVRIRGEISGLSRPASGHVYFSLKDNKAVMAAICWKGKAAQIPFQPEDGLEVIATGRLTTYAGQSKYQLSVDSLEIAGEGALMALLEKRKKQLAAEGLFAAERKQKLPFLPRVIGIVTSPSGAVIRDMLHRIEERFACRVILWPTPVQGEAAAGKISEAIAGFNKIPLDSPDRPDVLIVARGGGSIEDLWAFNEENVVRAVAASAIPLISAVGHETDTTLIDYVADQRAPTPTAAAELAVPVRADLVYTVRDYANRSQHALQNRLAKQQQLLVALSRGLLSPARLLAHANQRLDIATERLRGSLPHFIAAKTQALTLLSARIRPQLLEVQMAQLQEKLTDRVGRLGRAFAVRAQRADDRLKNLARVLQTLSHQSVLERGFALVRGVEGAVITRAASAGKQAALTIQFADGDVAVSSTVSANEALPTPVKKHRKKREKRPVGVVDQGSLF